MFHVERAVPDDADFAQSKAYEPQMGKIKNLCKTLQSGMPVLH